MTNLQPAIKILSEALEVNEKHIHLMETILTSIDQITYDGMVNLIIRNRLYVFSDKLKNIIEGDVKPLNRELRETIRQACSDQLEKSVKNGEVMASQIEMFKSL